MPAPSFHSQPVLLLDGVIEPRFSSCLTRCVLRQTSATAASCEVVLLDTMEAAPLLSGPRDLLQRTRALGVVLGEGVAFDGLVRSVEVRWSDAGGSLVSLVAVGKLAAADTPPPTLTFQENLQQFTWSAELEPRLRVTARGLAGGLHPLRRGASAEIRGLLEGWSGPYRIGRLEWTWDLERGGLTEFEASRAAGTF